jgi:hypothetical protein
LGPVDEHWLPTGGGVGDGGLGDGLGDGGLGDGLGGGGGGLAHPPLQVQIWATDAPVKVGAATVPTANGGTWVHDPEESEHVPFDTVTAPSELPCTATLRTPPTYTLCALDATDRETWSATALNEAAPEAPLVVEKLIVPTSPVTFMGLEAAWLMNNELVALLRPRTVGPAPATVSTVRVDGVKPDTAVRLAEPPNALLLIEASLSAGMVRTRPTGLAVVKAAVFSTYTWPSLTHALSALAALESPKIETEYVVLSAAGCSTTGTGAQALTPVKGSRFQPRAGEDDWAEAEAMDAATA